MATIKVVEVIERVEDVLQDSGVRWPRKELQNWLNESYLQIVLLRPDANAKTDVFVCASGTKQRLNYVFPTAVRLLDIVRNVADTSDKHVVRLIDRRVLDDQSPGWHNESETINIQYFTFDERQPKDFYVYPPASDAAELEIVYADHPGYHNLSESQLNPSNITPDVIHLDDIYLSAITDWILYRAFVKDAEHAANAERALGHYQFFTSGIGNKTSSDASSAPSEEA